MFINARISNTNFSKHLETALRLWYNFIMRRKYNPDLTELSRKLRSSLTKEERKLWYDFLCRYPIRFKRQKVIDNYITDFYCADAALVIELDGGQHYDDAAMERDKVRTSALESCGVTVIRIPNNDINERFADVCAYIDMLVSERIGKRGS